MKRVVFVFLFTFFAICSFANSFQDRQEALSEIKKLIEFEEEIARTFEASLIDIDISTLAESFTPTEYKASKAKIDLDKAKLKLSYNLKEDGYDEIKEFKEFYSSSKYRDRTFVVDGSLYINFKDDFAKHIFDLLKYLKLDKLEECEIKKDNNNKKIDACIYNMQIYIDYVQDDDDYINTFKFLYHIDNFKNGPVVFQGDVDVINQNEKEFLALFAYGSSFYFAVTQINNTEIKYINIGLELKELK